jgi:psp operon transcriptional activator
MGLGPGSGVQPNLFHSVLQPITALAKSRAPVLLSGERGTPKEATARMIGKLTSRPEQPFLAVRCAGTTRMGLAAVLLGSDGTRATPGVLEAAHGGIAFLDDVEALDGTAAAGLEQLIVTGEVCRVGGDRPRRVDVMIVAATSARYLEDALGESIARHFEDRTVRIPPLRAHPEEIAPLATRVVERFAHDHDRELWGLEAAAQAALAEYAWPGNHDELARAVSLACARAEGPWVRVRDLPEDVRSCLAFTPRRPRALP